MTDPQIPRPCADCQRLMLIQAVGLCSACYESHRHNGSLDTFTRVASLPTVEALDLTWRQDALCAEVDPDLWFPEKGGSTREAKAVCARCSVRAECLDYALETGQRFGIYGGVSERGRRRLLDLPDTDDQEAAA